MCWPGLGQFAAPGGFWPWYLYDFAKTWSPGFRRDSGEARIEAKPATQNLGGAPSRLAWVYSPGLDLSAGGLFGVQQSKAGGGGGGVVLYWHPLLCCLWGFIVFTCSIVIDCVSGHVSAFLNLVGEFCVDIWPCWSGHLHVHAWRANHLAGGTVRGAVAVGTVFEQLRSRFCEFGQIYIYIYIYIITQVILAFW